MRLFIDTDVGGDFDDAHAIALALASPEVELVGISTVGAGGSALRRAQVASAIVGAAGRPDVPVHAGLDDPRRPSPDLARLEPEHILNAYTDAMIDLPVSPVDGVAAILDAARLYGVGLNLLTLCALTNVAAAFERDPAVMRSIGGITMMAGAFAFPWREANVAIDPEAADLVLRNASRVRMVGYDVGSHSCLPLDEVERAPMGTPELARLYSGMTARYRKAYRTDQMIMCDVSAMTAVLEPEAFEWRSTAVAVELDGRHTRGMTVATRDEFFNKVFDGTRADIAVAGPTERVVQLHRRRALKLPESMG